MRTEVKERINELFSSSDLFSGKKSKRSKEKMKSVFPDLTDVEIRELFNYLEDFMGYCDSFGEMICEKISVPWLPDEGTDGQLVAGCIANIREKYPEIDEAHIRGYLAHYCWLSNR